MTSTCEVPWLRSGVGKTPGEGGCIMQVIDWIDRQGWTDRPPCVHPLLARVAIQANDALDNDERQQLLDLVPRLMGTANDDRTLGVRLTVRAVRKALHVFENTVPLDTRPRRAVDAADAWCIGQGVNLDSFAALAAVAMDASDGALKSMAETANNLRLAAASHAAEAAHTLSRYVVYVNNKDAVYTYGAAAVAQSIAALETDGDRDYTYEMLTLLLDEHDMLTGRVATKPVDLAPVAAVMAEAV
jgi:hypothetical protein